MATAQIQTLLTDAAQAVADSDYPTAKKKLLQAEILFAAVPLESGKGGGAGTTMTWRESFERIRAQISAHEREESAATTPLVQKVPMYYESPRGVAPWAG